MERPQYASCGFALRWSGTPLGMGQRYGSGLAFKFNQLTRSSESSVSRRHVYPSNVIHKPPYAVCTLCFVSGSVTGIFLVTFSVPGCPILDAGLTEFPANLGSNMYRDR